MFLSKRFYALTVFIVYVFHALLALTSLVVFIIAGVQRRKYLNFYEVVLLPARDLAYATTCAFTFAGLNLMQPLMFLLLYVFAPRTSAAINMVEEYEEVKGGVSQPAATPAQGLARLIGWVKVHRARPCRRGQRRLHGNGASANLLEGERGGRPASTATRAGEDRVTGLAGCAAVRQSHRVSRLPRGQSIDAQGDVAASTLVSERPTGDDPKGGPHSSPLWAPLTPASSQSTPQTAFPRIHGSTPSGEKEAVPAGSERVCTRCPCAAARAFQRATPTSNGKDDGRECEEGEAPAHWKDKTITPCLAKTDFPFVAGLYDRGRAGGGSPTSAATATGLSYGCGSADSRTLASAGGGHTQHRRSRRPTGRPLNITALMTPGAAAQDQGTRGTLAARSGASSGSASGTRTAHLSPSGATVVVPSGPLHSAEDERVEPCLCPCHLRAPPPPPLTNFRAFVRSDDDHEEDDDNNDNSDSTDEMAPNRGAWDTHQPGRGFHAAGRSPCGGAEQLKGNTCSAPVSLSASRGRASTFVASTPESGMLYSVDDGVPLATGVGSSHFGSGVCQKNSSLDKKGSPIGDSFSCDEGGEAVVPRGPCCDRGGRVCVTTAALAEDSLTEMTVMQATPPVLPQARPSSPHRQSGSSLHDGGDGAADEEAVEHDESNDGSTDRGCRRLSTHPARGEHSSAAMPRRSVQGIHAKALAERQRRLRTTNALAAYEQWFREEVIYETVPTTRILSILYFVVAILALVATLLYGFVAGLRTLMADYGDDMTPGEGWNFMFSLQVITSRLNQAMCEMQVASKCSGGVAACNAPAYINRLAAYQVHCPYCPDQQALISTFTKRCPDVHAYPLSSYGAAYLLLMAVNAVFIIGALFFVWIAHCSLHIRLDRSYEENRVAVLQAAEMEYERVAQRRQEALAREHRRVLTTSGTAYSEGFSFGNTTTTTTAVALGPSPPSIFVNQPISRQSGSHTTTTGLSGNGPGCGSGGAGSASARRGLTSRNASVPGNRTSSSSPPQPVRAPPFPSQNRSTSSGTEAPRDVRPRQQQQYPFLQQVPPPPPLPPQPSVAADKRPSGSVARHSSGACTNHRNALPAGALSETSSSRASALLRSTTPEARRFAGPPFCQSGSALMHPPGVVPPSSVSQGPLSLSTSLRQDSSTRNPFRCPASSPVEGGGGRDH